MSRSNFSRPPRPRSVDEFVAAAPSQVTPQPHGDLAGYVRINIQITAAQQELLRMLAFNLRVSQAELVRQALGEWLEGKREAR